jgi:L-threonylcarbamoyladenylate synthase
MKKNDFSAAVKALQEGKPVIYPTDTLYALGADIYNDTAVRRIFKIKQRPYSVPLPVAVGSIHAMTTLAFINRTVQLISKKFLPGTLTIILKKKQSVPDLVTSGSNRIAVRIPNDPIALQLLSDYGPLTVTSANLHGKKTQSTIKEILMQLETCIPICFDNGRREGKPSTIVDLSTKKPQIVRKGSISEEEILDVISHG